MIRISPVRRVYRAWSAILAIGAGCLFTTCSAQVRVPFVDVDVSQRGVFVDILGGHVSVTPGQVLVDLPGVNVDIHGGHDEY